MSELFTLEMWNTFLSQFTHLNFGSYSVMGQKDTRLLYYDSEYRLFAAYESNNVLMCNVFFLFYSQVSTSETDAA